MDRKNFAIVAFATLFLTVTLFSVIPVMSVQPYDPWKDVNDDGVIDAKDYQAVKSRIPSMGTPLDKAYLAYNSGWIDISHYCGQHFYINHNLGSSDLKVEVTGKKYVDSGTHQDYYGLMTIPGWRKLCGDKTLYSDEEANCIIHTKDGGYAVAGTRYPSGQNSDILLMKMDSTGDVEWTRTYGGPYNDVGNSVIEASDGGYVIAGSTGKSNGEPLIYLFKTDMRGNVLWSETGYDPYTVGALNDVIEVSDGYVAVGFNMIPESAAAFAEKRNKSTGAGISGGQFAFPKSMFSSVVATDTGDLVFAGTNDNFAGMPQAAWWQKRSSDMWSVLGEKAYNATDTRDVIDDMVPMSDGGYVLAGYAFNVSNKQGGWLIRVNAAGDLMWENKYTGGGGYECHFNSVVAADDGVVVFGIYWDPYTSGAWTAQIATSGNVVWSKVDDQTVIWNKVAGTLTDDGGVVGYVFAAHAPTADYRCIVVRKVDLEFGLTWYTSDPNSIYMYRGSTDTSWNYVQVRIWTLK
jgi:hypothetical protein